MFSIRTIRSPFTSISLLEHSGPTSSARFRILMLASSSSSVAVRRLLTAAGSRQRYLATNSWAVLWGTWELVTQVRNPRLSSFGEKDGVHSQNVHLLPSAYAWHTTWGPCRKPYVRPICFCQFLHGRRSRLLDSFVFVPVTSLAFSFFISCFPAVHYMFS